MSQFKYAFALSRQEVREMTPPGTSLLIDTALVRTASQNHTVQDKHIHLVPEPSADPADPLNLPTWRKLLILVLMGLYAVLANTASSILSSAFPQMLFIFASFGPDGTPVGALSFSQLAHLIAVSSMMMGGSAIFWVPLSHTIGRRPVILLNLLITCAASIWGGKATSYYSLLAARVIQGCGGGAADAVNPVVIGEIFFVHQRGRAMAVYTMCLVVGAPLGGVVGGYVTSALGWRWNLYIPAIISGILFVLTFFVVPETLYERRYATSADGTIHLEDEKRSMEAKAAQADDAVVEQAETVAPAGGAAGAPARGPPQQYPPFSYARSLRVGIYRPGIVRRIWSPVLALRLPGTWMVLLHYGGLIGLIVTTSVVGPTILAAEPYLWGANVGLFNVGGLIGGLVGLVYAYLSTDWWSKRIAKRDLYGFAEPEARLPLMLPSLFVVVMGSLVFGLCAANPGPKIWVGICFGLGMICVGLMQIGSVGFNYILDAYGGLAGDCFLCVTFFRAVLSFVWTFVVGSWIDRDGVLFVFGMFTLMMGVFALTIFPVWLCGKRLRIATAKWVEPYYDLPE